ncbi:MAG: ribosome biogenesis GTPase Der [Planctomycetes bacterium]|nr:ribosome biogenesis GTPase Der [Planctomycetota bacterium]
MAVPVVAIIGRPNVGKSSIFNWLVRRRIAIVDPTAGVTRDRISNLVKVSERFFELVDTGGLGIKDVDNLTAHIEQQIDAAIDQASVILFVVDARSGITTLDEQVAARLRYVNKPILCVANKSDTPELETEAAEFYKLGRGKLACVSAKQNRNRQLLLDLVAERLPPPEEDDPNGPVAMKLAIVGRRNTGKSTFINSLAQSERMIVSEVPGTTRDSVDVRFERDGLTFVAIDTAGVRRKKSLGSDIEFYSLHRAERSVRRADVVLLFLDAQQTVSKVDKQLAEYVLEQHKPVIFVVNKWDLMAPMPTGKFGQYLRMTFPSLDFVPVAFITATSGKNVYAVLNLAQNLHKQASARVGTSELNRVLREALDQHAPPLRQNRRPKVYFATQVASNPPTIVLFTNGPDLFDKTYQRYLLKTFRDQLPFREIPIKLHLRHRRRGEQAPPGPEEQAALAAQEQAPPPPPEPAPQPRRKRRQRTADLSGLDFRTDVTDEEVERESKHYESELWKDL